MAPWPMVLMFWSRSRSVSAGSNNDGRGLRHGKAGPVVRSEARTGAAAAAGSVANSSASRIFD